MLNKEEGERFAELLGKLDKTELLIAKGSIDILLIIQRKDDLE